MIGFELKGLVVILILISAVICLSQYEEVWKSKRSYLFGIIEFDNGFYPKLSWWIWLFITIGLLNYAFYLNSIPPIILF